ncbi:Alternative oxidase 1a, mitochondrial [Hordeum vulgare]|nr:Alternative oxidase 1a, mitochondrial [Hordeum vulgare]
MCPLLSKLPNAAVAKQGKVSGKKNKVTDGSSRRLKKRLAGRTKDAAAIEASTSSLTASAGDAHNMFDEMPRSLNSDIYMPVMGVGCNNSHWSQTNEVHFDDHEFEVDEDGEECVFGGDILRETLAPRRHGLLIRLSDEEAALPPLQDAALLRGGGMRACASSRMQASGKFI